MSAPCPTCGGPVTSRYATTYCSRRCANRGLTGRKRRAPTGCQVRMARIVSGFDYCRKPVVDPNPAGVPLCAKHAAERARLLGGPCDDPDGCPHEPPFVEAS